MQRLHALSIPLLLALPGFSADARPVTVSGVAPRMAFVRSAPYAQDAVPARRVIVRLRRDMTSSYPDVRRRAVLKLAKLGTPEALQLVLDALGDKSGQVADIAQAQLAAFPESYVLGSLEGDAGLRSKDRWTRLRAAQAMGQLTGPVRAKGLMAALDTRDERCAAAVLGALERLASHGRLVGSNRKIEARLTRCLGARTPDGVRARALQALVAVDPTSARGRLDGLAKRAGLETQCSVLAARLRVDDPDAYGSLAEALNAEEPRVRAFSLWLVECGFARRGSIEILVDRLDAEPRRALRERVVRALSVATGLKHGDHVPSWRHALSHEIGEDWLPKAPGDPRTLGHAGWRFALESNGKGTDEEAGEARTVARGLGLGEIDPASDRFGILVDFSGSLWNVQSDGQRRKDRLDPEVERLLGKLDEGTLFFLVPYTAEVHPFDDRPKQARPRTVRAAQRFFRRARMRGQGDVWEAIELALDQRELDRVLIVTDGAPTGGRHWDIEVIIASTLERTRFAPVTFDVVLHGAARGTRRRWRRLCEATGGRLIVVDEGRPALGEGGR